VIIGEENDEVFVREHLSVFIGRRIRFVPWKRWGGRK